MENKRKIGTEYEKKAAEYLRQQGFLILEQNFYSRFGEIDIIAKDGRYFVFIEVKCMQRNRREFAGPLLIFA